MQIIAFPEPVFPALPVPCGVTALVGGGGKTTLMLRLARELSHAHKVVVTTTTHVLRPAGMPVLADPTTEQVRRALGTANLLFVGRPALGGKMTAAGIDAARLADLADYVLAEADGANGKPLKAPAPHEPVIPPCAALVIAVAGLDGVGQPIRSAAHRPALFAAALGTDESHIVTPADMARVLTSPDGQRRGVPAGARFAVALNKADDMARRETALTIAELLDPALADTALILSLKQEAAIC